MDKLEFKKLVKKCLIENGFVWHVKGKCYLRNMDDFTLKVTLFKSNYSLLYYVEYAIFVNSLNDENEIPFSIDGDIAPLRISYFCPIKQKWYDGYDLESFSTEEITHMLSTAVETEIEMYKSKGIRGLLEKHPWTKNIIYIKNKEYILDHYS